jgi:hypothetical protein
MQNFPLRLNFTTFLPNYSMKKFLSIGFLIVPLLSNPMFTKAVDGCDDPSYTFGTIKDTPNNVEAAKMAKFKFCSVVEIANA